MTRATPIVRSGNAGEISELLSARTDWDRYPASYRKLKNLLPVPQGPILRRSGTQYLASCLDGSKASVLVPFVFSDSQSYVLEFSELKLRIFDENGPLAGVLHIVTGLSRVNDSTLLCALSASTIPNARPTDEAHGAWNSTQLAVGDEVFLGAFPERFGGLNGQIGRINAIPRTGGVQVSGISFACEDAVLTSGPRTGESPYLRKIYTIASPYSLEEARLLQCTQQLDVLFLFCEQKPPYRLERHAEKHWAIVKSELYDGPYLDMPDPRGTIAISATGKPLTPENQAVLTRELSMNAMLNNVISQNSGSKYVASGSLSDLSTFRFDLSEIRKIAGSNTRIVDDNLETTWSSSEASNYFYLIINKLFVCTGYVIYVPRLRLSRAPVSWVLSGGRFVQRDLTRTWAMTWDQLDTQRSYSGYRQGRSHLFTSASRAQYSAFRFIFRGNTEGCEVAEIVLLGHYASSQSNAVTLTLTFSKQDGINHGEGLSGSDVGRSIRMKSPSDGVWRYGVVQTYSSATTATVRLEGLPFPDRLDVLDWRLGAFSDRLGWPTDGIFYRDRLILAGSRTCSNLIAGSVADDFLSFTPTSLNGEVLATHAFTVRLLSKRQVRIRNIESERHGVIVGCDTGVWVMTVPDENQGMGPLNIRVDPVTSHGVSKAAPLSVDRQVLFIGRARRSVREISYLFEVDGYKSIDLSVFSSHLGQPRFSEIVYMDDPYPVVWVRRDDGALVGMTYDKEQAVVGWHRHEVGGTVSSLCVIPQVDTGTDALWMVISRGHGDDHRWVIERLMPTWDFGASLLGTVDGSRLKAYAHFVDSGLLCETLSRLRARKAEFPPQSDTAPEWETWRNGLTRVPFGLLSVSNRNANTPETTLSGLWHLEGQEVVGLGDGNPLPLKTVLNGQVTYNGSYRQVVAGLTYESLGETSRLDVGGVHGTSQSLTKRIHGASLLLWDSAKGEIGSYSNGTMEWDDLDYSIKLDGVSQPKLYTGFIGLQRVNCDYNQEGIIGFRQTQALPFNVLGLIPRLCTQND